MDYFDKRDILMSRMLRIMRRGPYNANHNSIENVAKQIKELDKYNVTAKE